MFLRTSQGKLFKKIYSQILLRSILCSPLNFQGNEACCYIQVDNKVSRYIPSQYNLLNDSLCKFFTELVAIFKIAYSYNLHYEYGRCVFSIPKSMFENDQ